MDLCLPHGWPQIWRQSQLSRKNHSTPPVSITLGEDKPTNVTWVFPLVWIFRHFLQWTCFTFTFNQNYCYKVRLIIGASPVARTVKNLPAMQETWVWSRVGKILGETNGYPLQYFCLENPMDRGAWRATVYGSQRVKHGWATNTFTFLHDHYKS